MFTQSLSEFKYTPPKKAEVHISEFTTVFYPTVEKRKNMQNQKIAMAKPKMVDRGNTPHYWKTIFC